MDHSLLKIIKKKKREKKKEKKGVLPFIGTM